MSQRTVKTKQEFQKSIEDKVGTIRVENSDLASHLKIMLRIPTASFAIASVATGVVVYSIATAHEEVVYTPVTGGVSAVVRFGAGAAATTVLVSLLGTTGTTAMIGVIIALAGAGTKAYTQLKDVFNNYKIINSGTDYVVLQRKP